MSKYMIHKDVVKLNSPNSQYTNDNAGAQAYLEAINIQADSNGFYNLDDLFTIYCQENNYKIPDDVKDKFQYINAESSTREDFFRTIFAQGDGKDEEYEEILMLNTEAGGFIPNANNSPMNIVLKGSRPHFKSIDSNPNSGTGLIMTRTSNSLIIQHSSTYTRTIKASDFAEGVIPTRIIALCCGGGGGGSNAGVLQSGGGGGGAGVVIGIIPINSENTYELNIGKGGSAESAGGTTTIYRKDSAGNKTLLMASGYGKGASAYNSPGSSAWDNSLANWLSDTVRCNSSEGVIQLAVIKGAAGGSTQQYGGNVAATTTKCLLKSSNRSDSYATLTLPKTTGGEPGTDGLGTTHAGGGGGGASPLASAKRYYYEGYTNETGCGGGGGQWALRDMTTGQTGGDGKIILYY